MKVTNSRDGIKRFTVRVEHRVGAQLLQDFLCHRLQDGWDNEEELAKLAEETFPTPHAVVEALRAQLADNADRLSYWADGVSDWRYQILRDKAPALVARLFPDLN